LIQPIWLEDAKNVTDEQHEEFYRFIGNMDKPRYCLQYKTDAPINIRSLFYVPTFKPTQVDINQEGDCGVSLYSKKVLILSKANQILPRWLRYFFKFF
jgi:TNF receptor-associated protein 1